MNLETLESNLKNRIDAEQGWIIMAPCEVLKLVNVVKAAKDAEKKLDNNGMGHGPLFKALEVLEK